MSEDELVERAAAELRRPVRMDPALDDRVMAAVRAMPRHERRAEGPLGGAWTWLARPRTIRVSPLIGLAAAAAIVGAAVLTPLGRGSSGTETPVAEVAPEAAPAATLAAAADPAADSGRVVQFVFVAPTARSVTLVGDFNQWNPEATPLEAGPTRSVWTVRVRLPDGRHRYAFVVDDSTWAADPGAPPAGGDDFGVPSSVVTVTGSRS